VATAVVTALLASACAGPAGDGSAVAPGGIEEPGGSSSPGTSDTPEAAADAALEFFAAFDEIVLTGDEAHWSELSSADCSYCTAMAGYASTFGLAAGLQDIRATDAEVTLEELGLGGFDVEVVDVARSGEQTVDLDVVLEQHLSDNVPVSPQMVDPDGTLDATRLDLGAGAGRQPARVTMTHDGERWTVADVTAVPGGADARAEAETVGTEEPAPPSAMSGGDVDGAVAALEHFLALEQHVYRTGEVDELDRLSAPDCVACRANRDLALEAFAAGFEIEAGRSRVELVRRVPAEEVVAPEDLDPERDEDVYLLETRVHTTDTTVRTPEGDDHYPAGGYDLRATLLHGQDGQWYVVELTEGP
jgi:hypothetical protein